MKRNPMRLVNMFMAIAFGMSRGAGWPSAPRPCNTIHGNTRQTNRRQRQGFRMVTVNGFELTQRQNRPNCSKQFINCLMPCVQGIKFSSFGISKL